MEEIRCYRAGDEGEVVRLWNRYIAGLYGCYPITEGDIIEEVVSKSYFEPEGLIVAGEGGGLVGFVHSGFFAPDRIHPDRSRGTICMLVAEEGRLEVAVRLVERGLEYLRGRGAKEIRAFDIDMPRVPFYNGMYGGEKAGLDEEHPLAAEALEACGFVIEKSAHIMTIDLGEPYPDFPQGECEIAYLPFPSVPEGRSFQDSYGLHDKITKMEARVGSGVAGSLLFWQVERMEETTGRRLAVCSYVHVEEGYRGTGVAQSMFRALYERLISQGIETLGLGVNVENRRAIRFYEKVGFKILKGAHTYILR